MPRLATGPAFGSEEDLILIDEDDDAFGVDPTQVLHLLHHLMFFFVPERI
jgi:hypothetical protein